MEDGWAMPFEYNKLISDHQPVEEVNKSWAQYKEDLGWNTGW